MRLEGFGAARLIEQVEMTHGDLEAVNTAARPQTVAPVTVESARIEDGRVRAALKPLSYNVIRLSV